MTTVPHYRCHDPDGVVGCLTMLAPQTVILDVEPLVAHWHSGDAELRAGVDRFVSALSSLPTLRSIVFATNARRQVDVSDPGPKVAVRYHPLAAKPLRAARYRHLPAPGAVVGDQVATDGALAWRLGYAFLQYVPPQPVPFGSRLLGFLGAPLRPLLLRPEPCPG